MWQAPPDSQAGRGFLSGEGPATGERPGLGWLCAVGVAPALVRPVVRPVAVQLAELGKDLAEPADGAVDSGLTPSDVPKVFLDHQQEQFSPPTPLQRCASADLAGDVAQPGNGTTLFIGPVLEVASVTSGGVVEFAGRRRRAELRI